MAYKTVKKNGRWVTVNTLTGKEVRAGERIGNELNWAGKGINDNFTYSNKSDKNGNPLTPAQVRQIEGGKPKSKTKPTKPSAKPGTSGPRLTDAQFKAKYGKEMENPYGGNEAKPTLLKAAAKLKAPPAPKLPPATTSTATRTASRKPSMSQSKPKTPAKAQPGDMNDNYRTWAAKYDKLAARVKQGQSGYNAFSKDAVAGVGPVKDATAYKPQAEKTSEMNASTVRRAALTASASALTGSNGSDTPKEKPKGTAVNFRTDIALLDKKKKK